MSYSRVPRHRLALALAVVTLAVASCADDGKPGTALNGSDPTTTTEAEITTTAPPATTTTAAAPTAEEEVLAAYAAYWAAVDEALGPPQADPDAPGLREHATGEVLPGIVKSAEELRTAGEVVRIPQDALYAHSAEVVSLDTSTATVRDCNINDAVLETAGTGQLIDDEVSTRLYVAMLVKEGGSWKVATLERADGWDGVAGCAVE